MEDKAPVHTAHYTQAACDRHQLPSLAWPASSTNLNPIKGVWRRMKDFIYRMEQRPTTIPKVIAAVQEACHWILDIEVRQLVDTMPGGSNSYSSTSWAYMVLATSILFRSAKEIFGLLYCNFFYHITVTLPSSLAIVDSLCSFFLNYSWTFCALTFENFHLFPAKPPSQC